VHQDEGPHHQIDNDQTDDYVNKLKYDSCITMESVEFYDNVKKLSITESSTMRLWCDWNVLSLSSSGQFSNIMLNVELQKAQDLIAGTKSAEVDPATSGAVSSQMASACEAKKDETESKSGPMDASVMTVDPMNSSSLEKRFSCIKRGSALYCRKPREDKTDAIVTDEDYPLSFVMRIAKSKR